MKKLVIALLIILIACQQTPQCNPPYFEWQKGACCLDINSNRVCDSDEKTESSQSELKTIPDITEIPKIVQKPAEEKSTDRVVFDSLKKVVKIETPSDEGMVIGSGFFVSEDGYIITNLHVIEELYGLSELWNRREDYAPEPIRITTRDGTQYSEHQVRVIGGNDLYDIAVLQIISDEKFPFFEFAPVYTVKIGDQVFALGSPQGLDFSASRGVVSAKNRVMAENQQPKYIQTDTPINPGNSGGPLINSEGKVIGVNTYKYVDVAVEGLGFALESETAKEYYEALKQVKARIPRIICKKKDDGAIECEWEIVRPNKILNPDSEIMINKMELDTFQMSTELKNKRNKTVDVCFKMLAITNGKIARNDLLDEKITLKPSMTLVKLVQIKPSFIMPEDTWDEYIQIDAIECESKKVLGTTYKRALH